MFGFSPSFTHFHPFFARFHHIHSLLGCMGGPSPRSRYATPPPPLRALQAHLVTKGQWLLAIHRVAPKAPENFGDPRECRGDDGEDDSHSCSVAQSEHYFCFMRSPTISRKSLNVYAWAFFLRSVCPHPPPLLTYTNCQPKTVSIPSFCSQVKFGRAGFKDHF